MDLTRPTLISADKVRTANGVQGDAVLIQGGKVAAVGWASDLLQPHMAEERYSNTVLLPGLGDAHFHPTGYTAAITRLNLQTATDMADLLDAVRMAGRALPASQPIIGTRVNNEQLAENRLPTRHDLDKAVSDRPVMLYRYCGHVAIVNTAALELAGIGPGTPDPSGGSLDRDERGPNGILRETATELVSQAVGDRSVGLDPADVLLSLRGLVTQGITRLGAIIKLGEGLWCGTGDDLATISEIGTDLPLELAVLVIARTPADLEKAATTLDNAGPRVKFLGMKDFSDGSLGGHTAAMRHPYADRPDTRGSLRFDLDTIGPVTRTALAMGAHVALHAIGDLANHEVATFMQELRNEGAPASALRIEHASVLTEPDLDLISSVGALASVQPAFLTSEIKWLEGRVGSDRLGQTYAFRSMLDAGIPLAGGSDCPVEPPNPLLGMATAIDRAGISPEQCLTGAEALGLFTDGVATAIGEPPPLSIGSPANFTILDIDPVTATPNEIRHAEVVSTWVQGEPQAHDKEALTWR
jgi:predicted amidohydrolase YtcJ